MNLFEFEGKRLFAAADIPVPEGHFITSASAEPPLPFPFVLKAQVLTGGRGKAGGIKVCENRAQFEQQAAAILGMTIKGHRVHGLLCEQMVHPERELYLSITLQGVARPTLIASAAGGMEIEQVAAQRPEDIVRIELDPFAGVQPYQIAYLAKRLGLPDAADLGNLVRKLSGAFFEQHALLTEINPLGLVDGKLMAMDAKFVLDDHAEFRMKETFAALRRQRDAIGYEEPKGDGTTITFVPLDGEVGLISDGAGTGMLALDLVRRAGGTVASFCELGGTTPAEVMYKAMQYTMGQEKKPKSLLIVLIGGFNRMDDMANGITGYIRDYGLSIPVFTRMCGTMEEEGFAIMERGGLHAGRNLMETVAQAVESSREVRV